MYWFIMCFSDDGHIRVATLWNHMFQNNDFTKAFIKEKHLPEHQQHAMPYRVTKLVLYLLLMLMVAGQVCTGKLSIVELTQSQRRGCIIGCEESHFPLLSCTERQDVRIELHNNVYDKLYTYHQPAPDLPRMEEDFATLAAWASNETDNVTWPAVREVIEDARARKDVTPAHSRKLRELVPMELALEIQKRAARVIGWDLDLIVRNYALTTISVVKPSAERAWLDTWGLEVAPLLPVHNLGEEGTFVVTKPGVLSKAGLAEWNVVKEVFFNGELVETPQRLAEADLDLRGGTLEITYWATAESGSIHTCAYFAMNPNDPDMRWWIDQENRGLRTVACFSDCKRAHEDAAHGYGSDVREPCEDAWGDPNFFRELFCVPPDVMPDVRPWIHFGMFCLGPNLCCSWGEVFFAVFIGNTIQLGFEFLLYLMDEYYDDIKTDVAMSASKCATQCASVLYTAFLVLCAIAPFYVTGRLDVQPIIWINFAMAVAVDQVKNVMCQPVIWWCIILRCGRINPGIQEYNEDYIMQWEPQDSLLLQIRITVKNFLNAHTVRMSSIILVCIYAAFVIFWIVVAPLFDSPPLMAAIVLIDKIIIHIFTFELLLKLIAFGPSFLWPTGGAIWEGLDAVVIAISLVFAWTDTASGGVALLRLLRLLRVILIYKKVSASRLKMKQLQQKNAVKVGTQQGKVVEILEDLMQVKALSHDHRDEIEWALEMITRNKLYTVALSEETEEEKAETQAIHAWLMHSAGAEADDGGENEDNLGASRMSKIGASLSKGIKAGAVSKMAGSRMIAQGSRMNSRASRRASKQQQNRNQEGKDDEYTRNLRTFYELCWISPAEETHIEETLHALDDWGFDGIQVEEMIGKMAVPIVFCRLATLYDFLGSLSLDSELLCNFTKKVQSGFSEFSQFHGSGRAVDMIQAVHYFHIKGLGANWTARNVELLRFTLFTAALVANCGHPGYTTEFLVKTRHLRALRYNDENVLKSHTMAFISQQLRDPETNFSLQWESGSVKHFRELLIRMVLKLDLHRHFQELGELNSKVSSDLTYPQDTLDDRTSMACFALRAADLACRARPNNIYNRWIERHAEENFCQGDMERQVGVSISAFCDRDAVNIDKMEYAILSIIVSPYLSAFALVFDNRQWTGSKDLQKEMLDDGEATNRTLLHEKLVKEAQGTTGRH